MYRVFVKRAVRVMVCTSQETEYQSVMAHGPTCGLQCCVMIRMLIHYALGKCVHIYKYIRVSLWESSRGQCFMNCRVQCCCCSSHTHTHMHTHTHTHTHSLKMGHSRSREIPRGNNSLLQRSTWSEPHPSPFLDHTPSKLPRLGIV